MFTQEAAASAPLSAGAAAPLPAVSAAPVSYAEVRTPSRVTRAVLGTILLTLALTGWASGIPGAPVKAAAAVLLIAHALVDLPAGRPIAAITLDALLLCATAGIGNQVSGSMVGAVAYLMAAGVLLVARWQVFFVVTAAGAGAALRLFVFDSGGPAGGAPAASLLAAIESALYLTALALLIVGAAHSVSQARHRQAEALAAEQRAAAMKNEFVSMVSHELRTPLTNIAGFATALRESWRTFDPTEVDEFLGVVCRESDHLRALVDDVLVVPRLEAGRLPIEPTDFPLRPAAFRIAGLVFPPGGDKSVSVSITGNVVVRADPNRVEQVLRNLLENAARHGGAQVTVEAAPLGAEWLVVVADDGPGVPSEHRDRVFDAFEQADPGAALGHGLGLGLTVCRVLVGAMGGRIWYEPGFPTGARFCFTLPAAVHHAAPVPAGL